MFADNVVHFARVLRHAGLAVGPDRVLAALEAIEAVGLARRDDVHAALDQLARDRMMTFQELADEAFRDLLKKHGRPTDLRVLPFHCGAQA